MVIDANRVVRTQQTSTCAAMYLNCERNPELESTQIKGFTDIHTHLLPEADDGAADISQARQMLRAAWKNGTRTMILTPHYRGPYKENTPTYLQMKFDLLNELIEGDFPGMKLYLGSEIHYQTEVPERLTECRILTLADSQYILLEFQYSALRSQVITGIIETSRCGFTPIVAHAERYDVFRKDSTLVEEVLELGALIQLNADSVMGKQGLSVKRFCHKLLKAQNAHFVASDAHDTNKRPPLLRDCFLWVHKKYGAEYAARVFYHNAQAVIENRTI